LDAVGGKKVAPVMMGLESDLGRFHGSSALRARSQEAKNFEREQVSAVEARPHALFGSLLQLTPFG
jgi:hypothetical protein